MLQEVQRVFTACGSDTSALRSVGFGSYPTIRVGLSLVRGKGVDFVTMYVEIEKQCNHQLHTVVMILNAESRSVISVSSKHAQPL